MVLEVGRVGILPLAVERCLDGVGERNDTGIGDIQVFFGPCEQDVGEPVFTREDGVPGLSKNAVSELLSDQIDFYAILQDAFEGEATSK